MAETLTLLQHVFPPTSTKSTHHLFPLSKISLRQSSVSRFSYGGSTLNHQIRECWRSEERISRCGRDVKMKASWVPLMAVMVEHMEGQRDLITYKSIWHLSDQAIKNVYAAYIFFVCWGCCFFGSMKDPYYDSEHYRGDGGDGSGHWVYDKQEDIEERARAELWREELIEEIEQKVGSLRELEETTTSPKG
ncbi:photosynthetic NDH subunit of subcomplex B 4, chloroplastic [Andrographis paniculata]|uniref:photosynthetic NDH subunit of subcomplex B 4, chloroplastic n=1 Tax=Andrographis paniculata TaxID=175694 RepID=UPI0021E7CF3B|nr:photosynthetic NDH subunit of subcomplex B 4, chloroplastic [Andrographis paniculata]